MTGLTDSGRSHGRRIVLNARGIGKSFGRLQALDDLTLEVCAGEILGLLGPNGAGKTTAIRILSTLLVPSRGHFTVMDVHDSHPEAIRGLIGVLPESSGFPVAMSGAAYLAYMGRLYGQSKTQAKTKAAGLLEQLGLECAAGRRMNTYSRGMKQRLMIARALINDPKLLFLDEPTLGLDPKGQRTMLQTIRAAADIKQVAVILSSHSMEVVESVCHRVLILKRGRILAQGPVADIKRHVAMPQTCRIQFSARNLPDALSVLSSIAGVSVADQGQQNNELLVSYQGAPDEVEANAVLGHLINAGIPIEAFHRESVRLSDAFLSMTGEGRA